MRKFCFPKSLKGYFWCQILFAERSKGKGVRRKKEGANQGIGVNEGMGAKYRRYANSIKTTLTSIPEEFIVFEES